MRQAQARESAEGSGKPAERNQEAITTASTLAVLQESERNGQEARVEREAIEHCEPSRVLSSARWPCRDLVAKLAAIDNLGTTEKAPPQAFGEVRLVPEKTP